MKLLRTLRPPLVILCTIVTLGINALASTLPLNGLTTGEISDRFPVLITPAGYVFAIWGVIYIGLIAYSIYQALPAQRTNPLFDRISWLYILSAMANCVWIFLWHYLYIVAAVPVMILLFVSLLYINFELSTERTSPSRWQNWTTHLPFDIYLGWISLAMAANIAIALSSQGFTGGNIPESWWASLILSIIAIISAIMIYRRHNRTYGLVIVWSIFGILIQYPSNTTLLITGILAISIQTFFLSKSLIIQTYTQ